MAKEVLFMTVDLGTSFIKAGVYDTESHCIVNASEPVKDERPRPGVFIQRGEEIFEAVLRCIKKGTEQLGDRAQNVAAMAFTGQMAGFMAVDKDWNDVTTWSCSVDTRFVPFADRQMKEFAEDFLEISGTNAPQMCSKFEWFCHDFPEEAKRIAKCVMISGYVLGKLGQIPIEEAEIDGSLIAWSGMADIRKAAWSDVLCEKLGMDKKYLPKIVDSSAVCGTLCEEMAKVTGLKSGIPLVAGAGDKVAGCVGAGILNIGDMIFEAGSYGGFSCTVEDYRPDREEHYFDGIIGPSTKTMYAHKYISGSGISLDWFADTFASAEKKKEAFAELEGLAAQVPPGSDGVLAIGLMGGSSMPYDGDIRGLWMGHNWAHGKGHFYRSLLESFSYDLALTIDRVAAKYPEYKLDTIKIIGGGAKSAFWTQMLADVTGRTFQKIDREDIALWGAAILAGHGIGVFSDLKETADRFVGIERVFTPDMDKHVIYSKYKELYRQFVKELHPYYVRLAETAK